MSSERLPDSSSSHIHGETSDGLPEDSVPHVHGDGSDCLSDDSVAHVYDDGSDCLSDSFLVPSHDDASTEPFVGRDVGEDAGGDVNKDVDKVDNTVEFVDKDNLQPVAEGKQSSTRSLLARGLIKLVRFYQMIPKQRIGPVCRFQPSCSRYAIDALEVHGAWYGTWLTVKRLLRCRPLGPWGFDPIPPPRPHR